MRRMRTGRDAAPEGSAWSAGPPVASGAIARLNKMHGETTMPKLQNQTSARISEARLLRFARNDVDISVDAVIARSAQRDEAISATRVGPRAPGGGLPRFGETNPRLRFGET